jgi:hypothetical protein
MIADAIADTANILLLLMMILPTDDLAKLVYNTYLDELPACHLAPTNNNNKTESNTSQ